MATCPDSPIRTTLFGAGDELALIARHETRKVSAMIEMRVRQDDRVNRIGAERERAPVALAQLLQPLKQSRVNEDAVAAGVEKMLRTGDRAGGAKTRQCGHRSVERYNLP